MNQTESHTVFSKRIVELQDKHGYTDDQILDLLRKSNGDPWIKNTQTYYTWRSGTRMPSDFQAVIVAFADFYGVSTDYLLREDAPETPQIKTVQDATGLSVDAVRNIMDFNNSYPEIMKMIDTIFSYASGEGQAFIINLYNQILNDYRDRKTKEAEEKAAKKKKSAKTNKNPESTYDFNHEYEQMQSRILHTQLAYNYISSIVMDNLSDSLDNQLQQQDYENEYYSSNNE